MLRAGRRFHRLASALTDCLAAGERIPAQGGAGAIDVAAPFGNPHLTLWPPGSSNSFSPARQYGLAAAAAVAQQGPLSDVQGTQQGPVTGTDTYLLKIVTGNLRGAGTHSPAWVRLVGTNGTSERFKLGEEDTFERGSSRLFPVLVPAGSIGQLRRVHVEKRKQTQLGDGWFLKHVEVEGPAGDRTLFPCNAWLGESDCGGFNGPSERNLLPAPTEAVIEHPGQPVNITASGISIPHPEKVQKTRTKGVNARGFGHGGEDAYFYARGSKLFGMGVADGIYMWREMGIDAGRMSRELMAQCKAMIEADNVDIFKVLATSVDHVLSSGIQGSTTVCLLAVDTTTGALHSANIGDSGFIVYGRKQTGEYELKFRTNQLEHSFGYPFQIGHQEKANKVEDADLASFHLQPGDVIVMGSDGLLDNLADLEMQVQVRSLMDQGASPSTIAQRLTKLAFEASVDKKRVTPYSKGASEAFDMVYSGGKPDDITVIVAVVK